MNEGLSTAHQPWRGTNYHTGLLAADGSVADPLWGTTHASVDAFVYSTVGDQPFRIAINGAFQ